MIDFKRLLSALVQAKVELVIVGGVAATLHGSARLTVDLDIVYGGSEKNMRKLMAALQPLKSDAGALDPVIEIPGGFDYEVLRKRSTVVDLFGLRCRVMDLEALIESKIAAGRPKDLEVIAELQTIREERGR